MSPLDLSRLALALAGATRDCTSYCNHGEKCGGFHSALNACLSCPPFHTNCRGTGRAYLLGERARKPCQNYEESGEWDSRFTYRKASHPINCRACESRGWFPALLEEPEACPDLEKYDLLHADEPENPDMCRKCNGSDLIQRERVGLLIELLEEAGYVVSYLHMRWFVDRVSDIQMDGYSSLLVAACQATKAVECDL